MPTLYWILLATLFGGLLSAALAGAFGLLPEAVAGVGPGRVEGIGAAVLAGIAFFFVLEKFVLWRHCHTEDCESHQVPDSAHRDKAAGWIVLIGDGVHNGFDGVLIAAAFLTDVRLGILTTIAITAHEIPQELGDLAVLLHAGMKPVRALMFNTAS